MPVLPLHSRRGRVCRPGEININYLPQGAAEIHDRRRRLFGQLTRRQVWDLYQNYKEDHDLFGYSVEPFMELAEEDLMS